MTVSIWQADGTQPRRVVDVLVIGAGLAGASAAWFARQHGREVVISEARSPGLGASSRNAGFMLTGLDAYYHTAIERYGHAQARELWALSKRTHAIWRECIAGGGVTYDQSGSMLLAESEAEAADLRSAARAMQADGIQCEYLDHDPIGRGYHAAIVQPEDGRVQPYELVMALVRASGAEVVSENECYALESAGEQVRVYTRKLVFEARHVILCTNAYSGSLHPYFASRVIPTRAQCIVTAPLETPAVDTCTYSDYGYMYTRMTFDNRLLIGGGRKLFRDVEGDTTDDRVSDGVQGTLEAYLRARFPEVSAPVERRWAGIMGFSADGAPLAGTLPGLPRVGFAVGFTGHGLSFAAGTAERLVDHLFTGAPLGAIDAARLG